MTDKSQYQANDCYTNVAIANGQSASGEIDLAGTDVCGFMFPAAMTGTTMTIQATDAPSGTYREVQKDELGGGAYTITITANKYVPITNLAILAGARFIKLVSSGTELADRVIVLVTRPI